MAGKKEGYRRADRPEQKDERRRLILEAAAAELAGAVTAEDFTLEAMARRAGLAKGTVYLYFDGKSAILLELLGMAVALILEEVIARLARLPEPAGADAVAGVLRDCLKKGADSQRLVRLLKSLSEKTPERARRAFRRRVHPLVGRVDADLVRKLPGLRPGEGRQIVAYAWALLLGLSEMGRKHRNKGWGMVNRQLGEALALLIEGYLARSRRGR